MRSTGLVSELVGRLKAVEVAGRSEVTVISKTCKFACCFFCHKVCQKGLIEKYI